jgi:hypothetical protein
MPGRLRPDSQIGLTMAVPVDVATGPGGPEPALALAVPGKASEGRSLGQTGGQRPGLLGEVGLPESAGPALARSRKGEVRIAIRSRVTILIG